MARGQLYFGNVAHAQWVPMPRTGMIRRMEGNTSEIALDNGGLWIDDSAGEHAVYEMEFPVADKGYEGIEAFERFKRGDWGRVERLGRAGYLRFVDPVYADRNLFAPSWGTPGSIEDSGWKPLYDTAPAFMDVTDNAYEVPLRAAIYSITGEADAEPVKANSVHTFIIPPTHTLHLGATGLVTGDAQVSVVPVLLDGSDDTVVALTPSPLADAPDFPVMIAGSSYRAARVFLTRTDDTDSTVILAALRAQVLPTGVTPVTVRHFPGYGHMGCRFRASSRVDTYIRKTRAGAEALIGASLVLAEVESWRP